jgi:hypothetical protein
MTLTTKLIIKDDLVNSNSEAVNYIANGIRNPDKGSEFDIKTREIRDKIPDNTQLIKTLAQGGYDIMLGYDKGSLIGHMAFQEHNEDQTSWKMFHLYLKPEFRGKAYPIPLSKEFIIKAKENGIYRVRLGAGGHPIMAKIIDRIQKKYGKELGIESDIKSHWVTIKP